MKYYVQSVHTIHPHTYYMCTVIGIYVNIIMIIMKCTLYMPLNAPMWLYNKNGVFVEHLVIVQWITPIILVIHYTYH